jgi:hypothetical protein
LYLIRIRDNGEIDAFEERTVHRVRRPRFHRTTNFVTLDERGLEPGPNLMDGFLNQSDGRKVTHRLGDR